MKDRLFIQADVSHTKLPAFGVMPEADHVWDSDSINAINATIAAKRPLLVVGEPGVGKSQLAMATAKALDRHFISFVVDANTDSRDLLWELDALQRLADAQIRKFNDDDDRRDDDSKTAKKNTAAEELGERNKAESVKDTLPIKNYLRPGPLWQAFNWVEAKGLKLFNPDEEKLIGDPNNGAVVLIDEIDKGESDVPNGLLSALGNGCFEPPHHPLVSVSSDRPSPIIIITSNGERTLPDAFLRRCLVLEIRLPNVETERGKNEMMTYLRERGRAHFPLGEYSAATDDLLDGAAKLLIEDRQELLSGGIRPVPGQAEYLDLLRVVLNEDLLGDRRSLELLNEVKDFVIKKHGQGDDRGHGE